MFTPAIDDFAVGVYDGAAFLVRFPLELARPPFHLRELVNQCYAIGYRSLPLITLTGLVTGLVFTKQSRPSLEVFGATSWLPSLITIALVRSLAPLITALIVAGKVGSSIGAELGSMKVTEQIEAMRAALTRERANVRRQPGRIALFGVEPEQDCRGLGLIVPASEGGAPDGSIERFCEKPDAKEIDALRRAGALVNTFVMVGHVSTFVHQMAKASASWWRGLSRGPLDPDLDEEAYATLDPADFSKDVIENRLDAFRCVQLGPVGWSDLGEPRRLERVWPYPARESSAPVGGSSESA